MGTGVPAAEVLPERIVSLDQWLCWRIQERNGKPTKVPVNPHTGSFGSATDPDSWASFEEARAYAIDGAADGLGFVFTDDDPIVGVDLDDCRVPATGTLTGVAPDVVKRLVSYTEVSPSGTGIHVLVEGMLPGNRNRRGNVEMYETARFFTVTGDHVEGTPLSIEQRHEELYEVHTKHVAPDDESPAARPETAEEGANVASSTGESHRNADQSIALADSPDGSSSTEEESTSSGTSTTLPDTELLERAKAAANGEKFARLWRGETSGYESHSEADMALCALLAFWSGGDGAQIDRLFRESGLMRQKWDERRFADGSTYGEKTVERVLAGTDEFYDPNPEPDHRRDETSSDARETDPSAAATIQQLRQDRDELQSREQDRLDLIEDLRRQVERLEAENERLRAELDERRSASTEDEVDGDGTSPSTVTRFRQWLVDDGSSG